MTKYLTQQHSSSPITSSVLRDAPFSENRLCVSEDGYVRLTFDELHRIPLEHFISGLDEDMLSASSSAAVATVITGYTEWLSAGSPIISIGWDWQMGGIDRRILLRRVSEPRSNLMLQDANRQDVGSIKTTILLEIYVDTLIWQQHVQQYIENDYG